MTVKKTRVRRGNPLAAPSLARRGGPGLAVLFALLGMAGMALGMVLGVPGSALAKGLGEEILESKYRHGDYAVFTGWHDPAGVQFDEHGSHASPFGLKARLRWKHWFRLEGDFSYYRRSKGPDLAIGGLSTPSFDGVMMSLTFQAMLVHSGFVRPYAGAGFVFVSLSDDFLAVIPNPDQSEDQVILDQVVVGSWSEFDVGPHVTVGLDFPFGRRFFPFVEYRQLWGEFTIDTVNVGGFRFEPGTLEQPSADLMVRSRRAILDSYDWGGPFVAAGLKILF